MEVTIKVSDQLAAEARAQGVSLEAYVQEILARRAPESSGQPDLALVHAAIDKIFELRKGNKLTGLRTRDLIREGRKY